MTLALDDRPTPCPRCAAPLPRPEPGPAVVCPACRWSGQLFLFHPVAIRVERAQAALPDDAACVHHPHSRAVATCAGSGDFICSLCSVEVEGKPYSARYLETGGRAKLQAAFNRYLDRPDRDAWHWTLLAVLPCFLLFMPIPLIFAGVKLAKAARLRRENPLFARIHSPRAQVIGIVLISVLGLAWLALIGIFLVAGLVTA